MLSVGPDLHDVEGAPAERHEEAAITVYQALRERAARSGITVQEMVEAELVTAVLDLGIR
jgi:hypothetical protein